MLPPEYLMSILRKNQLHFRQKPFSRSYFMEAKNNIERIERAISMINDNCVKPNLSRECIAAIRSMEDICEELRIILKCLETDGYL